LDRPTLAAYDKDAAAFATDWHEQPASTDLHEIVKRHFIAGASTADIGCGSGREVAWLNANGYPAKGFDASQGLLAEARARYPQFDFAYAELPDLSGIAADTYDNVLCETVIMHLERANRALGPPHVRHRQARRDFLSELARHQGCRSARQARPVICRFRCIVGFGGIVRDDSASGGGSRQRVLGENHSPHRSAERQQQVLILRSAHCASRGMAASPCVAILRDACFAGSFRMS
jgi:SAM-dependent methyltransferase